MPARTIATALMRCAPSSCLHSWVLSKNPNTHVQDSHAGHNPVQVEKTPGLRDALRTAKQMGSPIYVLFPGTEARDLAEMVQTNSQKSDLSECQQEAAAEPHRTHIGIHSPPWAYLLIAIDGTWRQGKEIFKVGLG